VVSDTLLAVFDSGHFRGKDNIQPKKVEKRLVNLEDSKPNPSPVDNHIPDAIRLNSAEELVPYFEAEWHAGHEDKVWFDDQTMGPIVTITFRNRGDVPQVSLKGLLRTGSGLSKLNRVALAVELCRVLYVFYGTAFMPPGLTSENFLFAIKGNQVLLGDMLLASKMVRTERTNEHHYEEPDTSKTGSGFGHASTMLGILLIEILLGREIPADSELDNVDSYTGRADVLRAFGDLFTQHGSQIGQAVKQCLGGTHRTLDVRAQRQTFLHFVLIPLEHDLNHCAGKYPSTNEEFVLVDDWSRAICATKDPLFPAKLSVETIQLSPFRDPTARKAFQDYVWTMCSSLSDIPWLAEALSEQGMGPSDSSLGRGGC
jgi:hypothetical protein